MFLKDILYNLKVAEEKDMIILKAKDFGYIFFINNYLILKRKGIFQLFQVY